MLIMENNTTIPKLTVILDDVRSIYNVGSAFRTADAVGVGEIVLAGFTPGPDPHPERIQKTALGAQQSVPCDESSEWGMPYGDCDPRAQ